MSNPNNGYLLDSGILIRHLRKYPGYREMIRQLAFKAPLAIASITRVEVVRGIREPEREATFSLLNSLITLSLDSKIADTAGELILVWRKQGIQLAAPDGIIAATALTRHLEFVTTNPSHFPMLELTVWKADLEGNLDPR
jgi:predicted nucleic acid-binding protein